MLRGVIGLFLCGCSLLGAQERGWVPERINFYFEDDIFVQTDSQYSGGGRLSAVFFLPGGNDLLRRTPFYDASRSQFVSFAMAQQIYTPADTRRSDLIEDDRSYAGWLYAEAGMHQSSAEALDSFMVQIGVIGALSGGEWVQERIHEVIGNSAPRGWAHQLNNEPGLNLVYEHKQRFAAEHASRWQSQAIPFASVSLGTVRTEAAGGVLLRSGWNLPEDFGASTIDAGGESGIPTRSRRLRPETGTWGIYWHVNAVGLARARNIFLDGNTFSTSHSVDKIPMVGYLGFGFCIRYRHVTFNVIQTRYTKQFETERDQHSFGSVILSYVY